MRICNGPAGLETCRDLKNLQEFPWIVPDQPQFRYITRSGSNFSHCFSHNRFALLCAPSVQPAKMGKKKQSVAEINRRISNTKKNRGGSHSQPEQEPTEAESAPDSGLLLTDELKAQLGGAG